MAIELGEKDFKKMPWKNGGGETLEIYQIPSPTNQSDFLFRISIAKVRSSGPFSHFPNIDRALMLISGDGFKLRFKNGREESLHSLDRVITFQGEEEIYCDLINGESTDFNVMINRYYGTILIDSITKRKGESIHFSSSIKSFIYNHQKERLTILDENNEYNENFNEETKLTIITLKEISKHK